MLEISPVLSGKFDQPSYVPATVNFTTGGVRRSAPDSEVQPGAEADARRYTKFDRAASNAGSTTDFSFNDFLDLINPLEHIPGISSIFRSLHGDTIHPVSRVAGDILYGGVLGLGSAVLGAVGAVADSVSEASNGQDATGMVVSALLGDDLPKTGVSGASGVARVALSDAGRDEAPRLAAAIDPSADASAQALAALLRAGPAEQTMPSSSYQNLSSMPSGGTSGTDVSSEASGVSEASGSPEQTDASTQDGHVPSHAPLLASVSRSKAYPLDRSKMPYGGVMAPVAGTVSAQALALAEASRSPQMGATVYTGRLDSSARYSPTSARSATPAESAQGYDETTIATMAAAATAAAAGSSGTSSASSKANASAAARNPLPQALVDDLMAMRAARQYQSVAAGDRYGFAH